MRVFKSFFCLIFGTYSTPENKNRILAVFSLGLRGAMMRQQKRRKSETFAPSAILRHEMHKLKNFVTFAAIFILWNEFKRRKIGFIPCFHANSIELRGFQINEKGYFSVNF